MESLGDLAVKKNLTKISAIVPFLINEELFRSSQQVMWRRNSRAVGLRWPAP